MADISNFYRGDTKKYKFDFGAGTDITGWQIVFTLKKNPEDADESADLQVWANAGSDPQDDVLNGIMYLTLPSDQTSLLDVGQYHYGFQRVIPGTPPDVKTLLVGKVKVLQDITVKTAP